MSDHTVLIVDDSSVDLEIISIVCRLLGCDTDVVADGFEAIVRYSPDQHDLVLCDYRMEPIDGIEVVSKIKEKDPSAKCIMVSGYPDAELRSFIEDKLLYDLVVKPIRADFLKETLRLALNASEGATVGLQGIALSNRMDQCSVLSGDSDAIQELRDYVSEQVAGHRPFLLVGSPSCGKREIAEFVHNNGNCAGGPCIFYDCSIHSEDEMYHALIDPSGAYGFQIQHAEKGTLILSGVDQLPHEIQKLIASAYDRLREHTRLILLSDSSLEDGLDHGTIDDGFYFKVGDQVFEVPEGVC